MQQNNKTKDPIIEKLNGIAVALSLLIISTFLYMYPEYLGFNILSNSIGTFLGIIGLVGFILEIGKFDEDFSEGFKYLGVGIFLTLISIACIYFLQYLFVKIIILFLSLLSIYSLLLGLFYIVYIVLTKKDKKQSIKGVLATTLNFLIFVLTVLQLLEILNIEF
ncbi:hypothetical protein [Oceanobacillus oncorhynchi]|uniref:hypothetical protein n=1 Tax=Oceanobacillus oncorhynchi TaxID=545501 RepID=UPI0025A468B7|nr:hypothetical protein [Oceanobacillus oncorhynchi]MDM8100925.1 hypothetical protein [Oceanobacillus oncorhynchi]